MKLAVVAGEASGDLHAGEVIRELKHLDPQLETFGIGGDRMMQQGTRLLHHAREMGIVGLFNVIRHLGMFRRVFGELLDELRREKPDAVLLVDYPDFNLRVAKKAKEMGLRVVYYISPQIWAWRRGRVKHIAKYVDQMIVIFPFEADFYREHKVPVTYVGHPLVEQLAAVKPGSRKPGVTRIALLPGSRRMEVKSLLPAMLDAIAILRREQNVEAFVIQAPTISRVEIEAVPQWAAAALGGVVAIPHDSGHALGGADVAISSSGTATLECAIVGTPVVVLYRLSPMTYRMARWLVKLPSFSLVNILAGRKIVPELLQHDVTGEKIAAAVRDLLARRDEVRAGLAQVRSKLGESGASRRAAEAIMSAVRR